VLKEAILRFGLPKAFYCDNGSLFVSSHLQLACARLGIALIHSKPYDSPSRGKIERFFRTVRQKFLSMLRPVDTIETLNETFSIWLEDEYHRQIHYGINMRPIDRFMEGLKTSSIQRLTEEALDAAFQITLHRRVKNDSTVSIGGVLYECPTGFIGKKIEIRHPSDKPQELTIYAEGKPVSKLRRLDPLENARSPHLGIRFSSDEEEQG
jgi:hypothetical protein